MNLAKSEILTYVTIVVEKTEMYNKELFQKVVKSCGMSGPKSVTDEGIEEATEKCMAYLFGYLQNKRWFMPSCMV